jgi:hypothetical protein
MANLADKRGEHKRHQLPHRPLNDFYKHKLVTVQSKSGAILTRYFSCDAQYMNLLARRKETTMHFNLDLFLLSDNVIATIDTP